MSQTALIYGGSGKVAQHITRLLASQTPPWTVYSVIRNPSYAATLQSLGPTVHTLHQSIEDASVDDLTATLRTHKPSVVIWSAGAGGKGGADRTRAVDRDGAIRAFDAAAAADVKRFIMVSANDVRDRSLARPSWYDDADERRSDAAWAAIGAYFQAKLEADKELVRGNEKRGLRWTIVRPSSLTEEPATGKVKAGRVHLGSPISREDVAAVVVECIRNENTVGLAFDVLGGDVPVRDAIERVAKEREDCFQGYF